MGEYLAKTIGGVNRNPVRGARSGPRRLPDGFFAPIIQIGDDPLSPPASTLLAAWVQKARPADRGSVALVVDRLRVLDSFPRRHRAGMSAAMAGSLVGAGLPPMVFASAPAGTDAIIVWASGSIDGVPFEASAAVPYREPM